MEHARWALDEDEVAMLDENLNVEVKVDIPRNTRSCKRRSDISEVDFAARSRAAP